MSATALPLGHIERAFLTACAWDVAVRKPGNVSRHSAGHGMQAQTFLDSAAVAAPALCRAGARVGERIEAAMAATWARVGCNTNLGILLLCAPLAAAAERLTETQLHTDSKTQDLTPKNLHASLAEVLDGLDREDAAAAFRAIVRANPGGLGRSEEQDVRHAPSVTLREAMALAAGRDRLARQYRNGFGELFDLGLATLGLAGQQALAAPGGGPAHPTAAQVAAVQRVYLAWLGSAEDSHLVRKQGQAVAQGVLREAQGWAARQAAGTVLEADPAFAEWDEALKTAGLNPGSSADLTVATLMAALLGMDTAWRAGGTERD